MMKTQKIKCTTFKRIKQTLSAKKERKTKLNTFRRLICKLKLIEAYGKNTKKCAKDLALKDKHPEKCLLHLLLTKIGFVSSGSQ